MCLIFRIWAGKITDLDHLFGEGQFKMMEGTTSRRTRPQQPSAPAAARRAHDEEEPEEDDQESMEEEDSLDADEDAGAQDHTPPNQLTRAYELIRLLSEMSEERSDDYKECLRVVFGAAHFMEKSSLGLHAVLEFAKQSQK